MGSSVMPARNGPIADPAAQGYSRNLRYLLSGQARIAISAIAASRLRLAPPRAWSDMPWNTAL